ncbi:MAG: HpcH/HpaI aldolase/citrate lyase family protein [Specibacter sp.]
MQIRMTPAFKDLFDAAQRSIVGMFLCAGDAGVAEICAGAGLDYVLIDGEHGPSGLETILAQLRAVAGYPCVPVVRVPTNDPVIIKQVLDLGAQSLIVPMVNTADQARDAVAAIRYAPRGISGVGASLARSARWNRIPDYLQNAENGLTLLVQLEAAEAVENAGEIARVDGIDGVFIGPADLAATLGLLGQQDHPDVVAAVLRCIREVKEAGKIVGVNAFVEQQARVYQDAGADFINVGADVSLLARGSEALAAQYIKNPDATAFLPNPSY